MKRAKGNGLIYREQLNTTIDIELHQKLKTYCKNTGMYKSSVVDHAITDYLSKQDKELWDPGMKGKE